ncbi:Pre-mRNA-splicing factor cwf19 [Lecanora helva]
MTLEDFEKSLAEERKIHEKDRSHHRHKDGKRQHKHHRHHHRDVEDNHSHKRRKRESDRYEQEDGGHRKRRHHSSRGRSNEDTPETQEESAEQDKAKLSQAGRGAHGEGSGDQILRDAWMEEPSALGIDFTQKGAKRPTEPTKAKSSKVDFELKIHDNELNKHHLKDLADGKVLPKAISEETSGRSVDYHFGDTGAQWRMTKLKGVYRRAEETGRSVGDIAEEQYGNLRAFDDAREEQLELDRRDTYGEGYVGKEKPNGELFEERKLNLGLGRDQGVSQRNGDDVGLPPQESEVKDPAANTVPVDQTALNRLKAQMLKAKVRGSSNASSLEAEYNNAVASFGQNQQADVVVLGAMENRMLAGSRKGEVTNIDNRRGRERGLVEENEDMTIEDMVKQERRNRHQSGGDGQRFAERIAKDVKFDNDLDYMDENANKLAKRVEKSEINLKSAAISDLQKMNRILDSCPLCHHEDTATAPIAPVVSLATRVYLTLPTEPEISDGGACIIPVQHRGNLLECDDDEWEEIRNFMKSLTRMYHDQGRDVIFYENAALPQKKKHAGMEVVPLPYSLGETAPAFFKEAILASDEEWTQHKKLIDTLSKAKNGLGKSAFRRTLVKEMPYFHVWFELDGGLGHVVEDTNRWPKGDLFAREIIGGMLDKEPNVIKKQGRWSKGDDRRTESFRKRWRKFDWTRVLTDA